MGLLEIRREATTILRDRASAAATALQEIPEDCDGTLLALAFALLRAGSALSTWKEAMAPGRPFAGPGGKVVALELAREDLAAAHKCCFPDAGASQRLAFADLVSRRRATAMAALKEQTKLEKIAAAATPQNPAHPGRRGLHPPPFMHARWEEPARCRGAGDWWPRLARADHPR